MLLVWDESCWVQRIRAQYEAEPARLKAEIGGLLAENACHRAMAGPALVYNASLPHVRSDILVRYTNNIIRSPMPLSLPLVALVLLGHGSRACPWCCRCYCAYPALPVGPVEAADNVATAAASSVTLPGGDEEGDINIIT